MIDIEPLKIQLSQAQTDQVDAAAEYRLDPDSGLKWENAYKASRIVVNIENKILDAQTQNENQQTQKENQNEEI